MKGVDVVGCYKYPYIWDIHARVEQEEEYDRAVKEMLEKGEISDFNKSKQLWVFPKRMIVYSIVSKSRKPYEKLLTLYDPDSRA